MDRSKRAALGHYIGMDGRYALIGARESRGGWICICTKVDMYRIHGGVAVSSWVRGVLGNLPLERGVVE